jgi:hypothetical protein
MGARGKVGGVGPVAGGVWANAAVQGQCPSSTVPKTRRRVRKAFVMVCSLTMIMLKKREITLAKLT